jgi:hypothetical protein
VLDYNLYGVADSMTGKKSIAREWLENFLAGGFLVLLALEVAYITSPILGGIIAALPIKFGITWILAGVRGGLEFAERMARGSIIGMTGNLLFSFTLFFSLSVLDFFISFSLAIALCLIAIVLLKFTFPK